MLLTEIGTEHEHFSRVTVCSKSKKEKHKMSHLTINKIYTDKIVRRDSFRGDAWAFDKNVVGTDGIGFVSTVLYFICVYKLKCIAQIRFPAIQISLPT